MLDSKIQIYLSDKMHLKKVTTKNMLNWDLLYTKNGGDTNHDLFQKNFFGTFTTR
jgi:hypothetical protein